MSRFRIKLILSIVSILGAILVLMWCWKSGPWNVGGAMLLLVVLVAVWYLMSSDDPKEAASNRTLPK